MLDDVTPHTAKFFSSDWTIHRNDLIGSGGTVPPNTPRGAATGAQAPSIEVQ